MSLKHQPSYRSVVDEMTTSFPRFGGHHYTHHEPQNDNQSLQYSPVKQTFKSYHSDFPHKRKVSTESIQLNSKQPSEMKIRKYSYPDNLHKYADIFSKRKFSDEIHDRNPHSKSSIWVDEVDNVEKTTVFNKSNNRYMESEGIILEAPNIKTMFLQDIKDDDQSYYSKASKIQNIQILEDDYDVGQPYSSNLKRMNSSQKEHPCQYYFEEHDGKRVIYTIDNTSYRSPSYPRERNRSLSARHSNLDTSFPITQPMTHTERTTESRDEERSSYFTGPTVSPTRHSIEDNTFFKFEPKLEMDMESNSNVPPQTSKSIIMTKSDGTRYLLELTDNTSANDLSHIIKSNPKSIKIKDVNIVSSYDHTQPKSSPKEKINLRRVKSIDVSPRRHSRKQGHDGLCNSCKTVNHNPISFSRSVSTGSNFTSYPAVVANYTTQNILPKSKAVTRAKSLPFVPTLAYQEGEARNDLARQEVPNVSWHNQRDITPSFDIRQHELPPFQIYREAEPQASRNHSQQMASTNFEATTRHDVPPVVINDSNYNFHKNFNEKHAKLDGCKKHTSDANQSNHRPESNSGEDPECEAASDNQLRKHVIFLAVLLAAVSVVVIVAVMFVTDVIPTEIFIS